MQKHILATLTFEILNSLILLNEATLAETWEPMVVELEEEENREIKIIKKRLQGEPILPLNEATVWGKAIFPILISAERSPYSAWANVLLKATFKEFMLEGFVDGTISVNRAGRAAEPHLIVVEAKKGENVPSPRWQLYGSMLTVVKMNLEQNQATSNIIHGCYTIADTWVFVRGEVSDIEAEKPKLRLKTSREYVERFEAEIILGILKAIVAENEQN